MQAKCGGGGGGSGGIMAANVDYIKPLAKDNGGVLC